MSALRIVSLAVIACCIASIRLAFLNVINLATVSALLISTCVIIGVLFGIARLWPRITSFHAAISSVLACLIGWFVIPVLVFVLLLAPFPQRWGLVGTWVTTARVQGNPTQIQREFSPFGTSVSYLNGELRSNGRYIFLDDDTIQLDWTSVPRRFTVGSQRDVYTLQLDGDTLTMTWTLTQETTVYHRAQT